MKYLILVLTALLTTQVFAANTKKKQSRNTSSTASIKCSFDNNGENKKDVSPNKPYYNGMTTNEHTFEGHTMSVVWNPGSPQESQTSLSMSLNGVNSVIYDINLRGRNSPINVMTAANGLIRFQCGVEQ